MSSTSGPTERIGGRLTEEAYRGWMSFAAHHGVSVTGLMEAIGLAFVVGGGSVEDTPRLPSVVDHARRIDAERARRAGTKRARTRGGL